MIGAHMVQPDRADQFSVDVNTKTHAVWCSVEVIDNYTGIVERHGFFATISFVAQPIDRIVGDVHAYTGIFDAVEYLHERAGEARHRSS